jgi:hypothetical protein
MRPDYIRVVADDRLPLPARRGALAAIASWVGMVGAVTSGLILGTLIIAVGTLATKVAAALAAGFAALWGVGSCFRR